VTSRRHLIVIIVDVHVNVNTVVIVTADDDILAHEIEMVVIFVRGTAATGRVNTAAAWRINTATAAAGRVNTTAVAARRVDDRDIGHDERKRLLLRDKVVNSPRRLLCLQRQKGNV